MNAARLLTLLLSLLAGASLAGGAQSVQSAVVRARQLGRERPPG